MMKGSLKAFYHTMIIVIRASEEIDMLCLLNSAKRRLLYNQTILFGDNAFKMPNLRTQNRRYL